MSTDVVPRRLGCLRMVAYRDRRRGSVRTRRGARIAAATCALLWPLVSLPGASAQAPQQPTEPGSVTAPPEEEKAPKPEDRLGTGLGGVIAAFEDWLRDRGINPVVVEVLGARPSNPAKWVLH